MSNTLEEKCRQLILQRKFEQCQKEIETAMADVPHRKIRLYRGGLPGRK